MKLLFTLLKFLALVYVSCQIPEPPMTPSPRPQNFEINECEDIDVSVLWSDLHIRSSFVSPPLLADLDRDGWPDIVGCLISGEVIALHGEDGRMMEGWPAVIPDRQFYTSPLLYDINSDGSDDIMLTTDRGEIVFLTVNGELMYGETLKIAPMQVNRDWYEQYDVTKLNERTYTWCSIYLQDQFMGIKTYDATFDRLSNSDRKKNFVRYAEPLYSKYHRSNFPSGVDLRDLNFVNVDAHILATPLIADFNEDGRARELIIPVSFYFSMVQYADADELKKLGGLTLEEIDHYLIGGVVVMDLYLKQITSVAILAMSSTSDDAPGFMMATPLLVNMNRILGRSLLVTSADGSLHRLVPPLLTEMNGFPIKPGGPLTVTPAVYDVRGVGALDIFIVDENQLVFAIDSLGTERWRVILSGKPVTSGGVRLFDVDNDETVDAVIVTQNGGLWAIDPITGQLKTGFQISTGAYITAPPILIHIGDPNYDPLWLTITIEGYIILYSCLGDCFKYLQGDHTLSTEISMVYEDIVPIKQGLEVLIASREGIVSAINIHKVINDGKMPAIAPREYPEVSVFAWPTSSLCQQPSANKINSVSIVPSNIMLVSGYISAQFEVYITGKFTLSYIIKDNTKPEPTLKYYLVTARMGQKILLLNETHMEVGEYSVTVNAPVDPIEGIITLMITDQNGFCDFHRFPASFNMNFKDNLKWFLVIPFFAFSALLLWLHLDRGPSLPVHATKIRE